MKEKKLLMFLRVLVLMKLIQINLKETSSKNRIIAKRKQTHGQFYVYHDFKHRDVELSFIIAPKNLKILGNINNKDISLLNDGKLDTHWSSKKPQEKRMSIEITLPKITDVHMIRLYTLDEHFRKDLPSIKIESLNPSKNKWSTIIKSSRGFNHNLKIGENFIPRAYNKLEQNFGFKPIKTKKLRLTLVGPNTKRKWKIAEIEVFSEENI